MDCSWLVDNDGNDDPGSESDPDETEAEVEARLYSIVHHSDLSQPLPPDLAKHYLIQCGDDGKLVVALNDSLENIKSEEVKKVDHLVKAFESGDETAELAESESRNDNVTVVSRNPPSSTSDTLPNKFRYSNSNLDFDTSFKGNGKIGYTDKYSHLDFSGLNYFEVSNSFFNKKKVKKFKKLKVPPSFYERKSSDWKDAANESFISVEGVNSGSDNIIDQMVYALKKANPNENWGNLYFLARKLFWHNRRKHKQRLECRKKQTNNADETLMPLVEEESSENTFSSLPVKEIKFIDLELKDSPNKVTENEFIDLEYSPNKVTEHEFIDLEVSPNKVTKRIKRNKKMTDGSITLNVSPFKPVSPVIDLVSEDENNPVTEESDEKISLEWNSLAINEVPKKWTKKMTKFYTKPSKSKMRMKLNDIFDDLKRRSTVEDWKLDPRDEVGIYQRTPMKGKHRNRRCPNCHQHGHLMHECPSPRKIPTCFLCGLNYHTAYSCPNKICFKCGVSVANEAYECQSCYYNTFNYDTPCEICGQITHHADVCPDLWRSFHATVDGEKKIPNEVIENKRKYCCNCAAKGHFSHKCPFPPCEGEHISSFVKNYSASTNANGTTEIVIPSHYSHIVENKDADIFFQKLSDSTNAVINVEERQSDFVFKVSGTFTQCRKVKCEIEEYVNTRKRKRHEPYSKKKRRKMR